MMYMSVVFYIKAQFVPEVAFPYPAGMRCLRGGAGREQSPALSSEETLVRLLCLKLHFLQKLLVIAASLEAGAEVG